MIGTWEGYLFGPSLGPPLGSLLGNDNPPGSNVRCPGFVGYHFQVIFLVTPTISSTKFSPPPSGIFLALPWWNFIRQSVVRLKVILNRRDWWSW